MRIGVFGGSFDPVHHGHLIVARALGESLGLDHVRFVAAGAQPLKDGRHGASPEHRHRMVELAVADEPGLVADPVEVERAGPSYMVDTLRALAAGHPGAALILLLGADAARDLPKWRDPVGIRQLAEVVSFPRDGTTIDAGEGVRMMPVPRLDLSSTDIRARVAAGLSIRYMVPERVAAYIAAHRLYLGEAG